MAVAHMSPACRVCNLHPLLVGRFLFAGVLRHCAICLESFGLSSSVTYCSLDGPGKSIDARIIMVLCLESV